MIILMLGLGVQTLEVFAWIVILIGVFLLLKESADMRQTVVGAIKRSFELEKENSPAELDDVLKEVKMLK